MNPGGAPMGGDRRKVFRTYSGRWMCRQCGMAVLKTSDRLDDMAAYENGFCSVGCEEVHDAIKLLEEKWANQEGR